MMTESGDKAKQTLLRPFKSFAQAEASGGLLLLAATFVALVWANSPEADSYDSLWEAQASVRVAGRALSFDLHHWINDGLMVIFFFVVGLEIKREVLVGELSTRGQSVLPAAAALGGMLVPALVFVAFNLGGEGLRGWGIPMATDIAFALGILALLGNRISTGLKVFLTALAIVDDLGAVLVIALFYGDGLAPLYLGGSALTIAVLAALNILNVRSLVPYIVIGFVLWLDILASGIHATVAGVLLAMTIPSRGGARSPLLRFEHTLTPWVSYAIMPLFALANAGVAIDPELLSGLLEPVGLGIVLGLVVGKQAGIMLFIWAAHRLGWAEFGSAITWRGLYGIAWLAGVGFTMSLFIANLAFAGSELLPLAKLAILVASTISGVSGLLVLFFLHKAPGKVPEDQLDS